MPGNQQSEFGSIEELRHQVRPALAFGDQGLVRVLDEGKLKAGIMEQLAYNAAVNRNQRLVGMCRWLIGRTASELGIWPASLYELYLAHGQGSGAGFTVPALNLRGLTFEMARRAFRAAERLRVGPFILEIARSEIDYTQQRPGEFAAQVLAAAVQEGWRGPVFLQGDHFQLNAKHFATQPEAEIRAVLDLIEEAIAAGFLNIDLDASTLVDMSLRTPEQEQRLNSEISAELTRHIRSQEPAGTTVAIGGEIGEVGGRNSTLEDLVAFMEGYRKALGSRGAQPPGLSKVSIQTGTRHGGVMGQDGSLEPVAVDFVTIEAISKVAQRSYGLAGVVQHGASTLPRRLFHRFPQAGTAEIHLATGFQNLVFDSPCFPEALREEMQAYVRNEFAHQRQAQETEQQFIYRTRKRLWGPFRRQLLDLPGEVKDALMDPVQGDLELIMRELRVSDTEACIGHYVQAADGREATAYVASGISGHLQPWD